LQYGYTLHCTKLKLYAKFFAKKDSAVCSLPWTFKSRSAPPSKAKSYFISKRLDAENLSGVILDAREA